MPTFASRLFFFMRLFSFFLSSVCCLAFAACQTHSGPDAREEALREALAPIPNALLLELDTQASYIDWTVRKRDLAPLIGRFIPSSGHLVEEKDAFIGCFLEGDLAGRSRILAKTFPDWELAKRILLDSFPRLKSIRGQQFRLDMVQSSRFVGRSEFRLGLDSLGISGATHVWQCQMELADSLQTTQFTFLLSKNGKVRVLDGRYRLQLKDFGVFVKPRNPGYIPDWETEVPIHFHLVFRPA
jgi:hypothetical protein